MSSHIHKWDNVGGYYFCTLCGNRSDGQTGSFSRRNSIKTDISFVYDIIDAQINSLNVEADYCHVKNFHEQGDAASYAGEKLDTVKAQIQAFVAAANQLVDKSPKS